jgi:hypothetical protein
MSLLVKTSSRDEKQRRRAVKATERLDLVQAAPSHRKWQLPSGISTPRSRLYVCS